MNPVSTKATKTQADIQIIKACTKEDLVLNSGVCVLLDGKQIAIFALLEQSGALKAFACDNYDPFGNANVLSRGLICSIGAEICICSPLYKQHFSLLDGHCLEDENVSVRVYKVDVVDSNVLLHMPTNSAAEAPSA